MALNRRARWALGLAGLVAVAAPLLLLVPPMVVELGPLAEPRAAAARPLAPPPLPPLAALYRRPLFTGGGEPAPPADAPDLLGIAGRIDADAVAMVRADDGSVRALRPGDSVDGWRLEALAADAASFVRGAETVRVPIAGGEGGAAGEVPAETEAAGPQ